MVTVATNQNIYGKLENWPKINTGFTAEEELKYNYYAANFAGTDPTTPAFDDIDSTLYTGIKQGKVSLDTPIDKSLCWCGLGNESAFSKIEYYNNKPHQSDPQTQPDPATNFARINVDNRDVTNFAFFLDAAANSPHYPASLNQWYYSDGTAQRYASCHRWAPEAYNGTDPDEMKNYNVRLRPITQLPMENCVAVPVVTVVNSITAVPSSSSRKDVYMWDYMNPNNAVNYTSHPYIINVRMQLWGRNSSGGVNRSPRIQDAGVAVTDLISACKDQPYDIAQPTRKQGESVQYSPFIFNPVRIGSGALPGMPIMGIVGQNSWTAQLPRSNGAPRKTRGTIVIPHPYGMWSYIVNTHSGNANPDSELYYVQYYPDFQEWVRSQIACFGLFFTDDQATAQNGALDSDNMFLGILDANLVGHGYYSHGEENRDQIQWNWDTTNSSKYDPGAEPPAGTGGYSDWTWNAVSLANATVRRYALTATQVTDFGNKLWDVIDTTDPDELIQNQTLTNFLTNNPLDCIVSLKLFPYNWTAGNTDIVLGKVNVGAKGAPFDGVIKDLSYDTLHVEPHFPSPDGEKYIDWKNYLCKYELYLPFCGTMSLDPETILDKNITVTYSIDFTTGSCTASVKVPDDIKKPMVIDTASGNCAIDVPISGIQSATLAGQIYNANENLKSIKANGIMNTVKNGVTFATSVATAFQSPNVQTVGSAINSGLSGIQGGINSAHDYKVAEWNINHTEIPVKMIGSSTGACAMTMDYQPRLLIYYPEVEEGFDEAAYLHSTGAACCESGEIGAYEGYIQATNVDLSGFNATEAEKQMIANLLVGGVYVG